MTGGRGTPPHVLVTGAANGIGAAVCARFARSGHRLSVVDLRLAELQRMAAALRGAGNPGMLAGDLADETFAEAVLPTAWERWGPVDIAVLAAGIYPAIPFLDMTVGAWDRVQAVNVRSAMQIVHALARLAIRHERPAVVVLLSSGAAQRARPGAAAYCASKAALELLMRAAALELGPYGIRVNAVSPGFVHVGSAMNPVTDAYATAMSVNPLGRPGRAEDIANAVHWLAGDEAAWITGAVLRVDGGASAGASALPLHWTGGTSDQIAVEPGESDHG
jgi:3-oxoacyl-[acyl-carrier protein] reductase